MRKDFGGYRKNLKLETKQAETPAHPDSEAVGQQSGLSAKRSGINEINLIENHDFLAGIGKFLYLCSGF